MVLGVWGEGEEGKFIPFNGVSKVHIFAFILKKITYKYFHHEVI
jgi:hypothetical protein